MMKIRNLILLLVMCCFTIAVSANTTDLVKENPCIEVDDVGDSGSVYVAISQDGNDGGAANILSDNDEEPYNEGISQANTEIAYINTETDSPDDTGPAINCNETMTPTGAAKIETDDGPGNTLTLQLVENYKLGLTTQTGSTFLLLKPDAFTMMNGANYKLGDAPDFTAKIDQLANMETDYMIPDFNLASTNDGNMYRSIADNRQEDGPVLSNMVTGNMNLRVAAISDSDEFKPDGSSTNGNNTVAVIQEDGSGSSGNTVSTKVEQVFKDGSPAVANDSPTTANMTEAIPEDPVEFKDDGNMPGVQGANVNMETDDYGANHNVTANNDGQEISLPHNSALSTKASVSTSNVGKIIPIYNNSISENNVVMKMQADGSFIKSEKSFVQVMQQ